MSSDCPAKQMHTRASMVLQLQISHSSIWLADGDVGLQMEEAWFWVHHSVLCLHSKVSKMQYNFAQPLPLMEGDDLPITHSKMNDS